MSIIKCPECNNEVSTSAEKCPHCGVSIYGNIKVCPDCGKVALKNEAVCTSCGADLSRVSAYGSTTINDETQTSRKKSKTKWVVLLIIIILAISGASIYLYIDGRRLTRIEQQAYDNVVAANDTALCNQYLANFPKGTHAAEVRNLLSRLTTEIKDWNDACINATRSGFVNFLEKHTGSSFEQACNEKIDSLDFADATATNTKESYQIYLNTHPTGLYSEQALQAQQNIDAYAVKPEDELQIKAVCRNFFAALVSNDKDVLNSVLTPTMDSFLNKPNASREDVVNLSEKIAKSTTHKYVYKSNDDYKIIKSLSDTGEPFYEVTFTVNKTYNADNAENQKAESYSVAVRLNNDMRISTLGMKRLTSNKE